MPSEANIKRAEPSEWAWRQVDRALPGLKPGEELGRGSVAEARLLLALSLDAAEQRGREAEAERWRKPPEPTRRQWSPAALAWLRDYAGSIDSTALLMAFEAGRESAEAELRRLRSRIEAEAKRQSERRSPAGQGFAAVLRSLLPDAETAEARVAEAQGVIRELADLMQGVIDHNYSPDSFTLQPARAFLAGAPAAPRHARREVTCDNCHQYGCDLDDPMKHPPEECPDKERRGAAAPAAPPEPPAGTLRGRCQGCGEIVEIDHDGYSHTRPEHDPACDGSCTIGCPVPVLCGPVTLMIPPSLPPEVADTYRGFVLTHETPPIPIRSMDWSAAPVDYDLGDPVLHGATREAVIAEVDRWWEEEAEDYPVIVERAKKGESDG